VKVAVTGSHGLIGTALLSALRRRGDVVIPIVRGPAGADSVSWDPTSGVLDPHALDGVDVVVHLAGAGVGDHKWSASYKEIILTSRTDGTATLARALAEMATPPPVLLSGSAVGVYGIRGDEELTEDAPVGSGFLAQVCGEWEAATAPAESAGVRVVHLRTGVVLSAAGGALKKQLAIFKLGLGARLGSGHQQLSWITRRDVVDAMVFLASAEALSGAVNVTAPGPVTNGEFTRALAHALHRPAFLAVPQAAMRVAVGNEMTAEFLQASQRVVPARLLAAGFTFADPELDAALVTALADRTLVPR